MVVDLVAWNPFAEGWFAEMFFQSSQAELPLADPQKDADQVPAVPEMFEEPAVPSGATLVHNSREAYRGYRGGQAAAPLKAVPDVEEGPWVKYDPTAEPRV